VTQILLVSFPHNWPGAVAARCGLCTDVVYEDQPNLDRVKSSGGLIICVPCALALKLTAPDWPAPEAQLWQGHIRKPEPHADHQPILDLLNAKVPK
jgi:hypothetical protein